MPAAVALHVNLAATSQGVGYGEAVANIPSLALRLRAIAAIRMQRVMGFTVITFFLSLAVSGGSYCSRCEVIDLTTLFLSDFRRLTRSGYATYAPRQPVASSSPLPRVRRPWRRNGLGQSTT